jgi:flotillin
VKEGGDDAYRVFMAEKLPSLLTTAVDAVKGVDIDRVVVMDGGAGNGVGNALNQRVNGALGTMEAIAAAVGLDLEEVFRAANRKALQTAPAAFDVPAPSEGPLQTGKTPKA